MSSNTKVSSVKSKMRPHSQQGPLPQIPATRGKYSHKCQICVRNSCWKNVHDKGGCLQHRRQRQRLLFTSSMPLASEHISQPAITTVVHQQHFVWLCSMTKRPVFHNNQGWQEGCERPYGFCLVGSIEFILFENWLLAQNLAASLECWQTPFSCLHTSKPLTISWEDGIPLSRLLLFCSLLQKHSHPYYSTTQVERRAMLCMPAPDIGCVVL